MPKKTNNGKINPDHRYSVHEAEPLLELQSETIKKKLRDGEISGIQKGSKKKWHIKGSEIIRLRKLWNLE